MQKFRLLEKTRRTIFYVNTYIIPTIPKIYAPYKNELINSMFKLHRCIISANINEGSSKTRYKKEALAELYNIDFLISVLKNIGSIETKRYHSMVTSLTEVKKMLIAWSNNEKKELLNT